MLIPRLMTAEPAPFGVRMGASSVMPARRTDSEAKELALVSLRTSFAPDASFLANPHSLIRERRADDRLAIGLLCGTAGYIDAVGVLTLMGMFPAHVTGEIIGLTAMLTAGHHPSHASRIAMLPTFVLALFVGALVARSRKTRGKSGTRALFALMAGSLAICAATGFFGTAQGPTSSVVFALREASIVAAMAFQNSLRREALAHACPTTVMTGNLMQLVFDVVDLLALRFSRARHEETHARPSTFPHLKLMASAVITFTLGAVLGGYLTTLVGVSSVAVPLVATLIAARSFA
ncbi:MAG TPA: YoaK family protein [Polyangiaceae bacterium]|nr:YoaK family protein [Polyangiaceae bacterium]